MSCNIVNKICNIGNADAILRDVWHYVTQWLSDRMSIEADKGLSDEKAELVWRVKANLASMIVGNPRIGRVLPSRLLSTSATRIRLPALSGMVRRMFCIGLAN